MYSTNVEIYSDASNMAVIRHPGRKFPGVLIQGDTLNALVQQLSESLEAACSGDPDARDELDDVKDRLESLLGHYKEVLLEHGLELPFRTQAGA